MTERTATQERAEIVAMLRHEASFLRTATGRLQREWHSGDANMVANHLDVQADRIEASDHITAPKD